MVSAGGLEPWTTDQHSHGTVTVESRVFSAFQAHQIERGEHIGKVRLEKRQVLSFNLFRMCSRNEALEGQNTLPVDEKHKWY